MAKAVAGARYVEVPRAGHLANLENPAAVNAALGAFLATLAH
jgi:pimeloyl-ACP methyl ester carboxylesterase